MYIHMYYKLKGFQLPFQAYPFSDRPMFNMSIMVEVIMTSLMSESKSLFRTGIWGRFGKQFRKVSEGPQNVAMGNPGHKWAFKQEHDL